MNTYPTLDDLLAEPSAWPVDHCAGSVNGRRFGDVHREFYLASVTKLLTARAVLVAVEEGALELDTTVRWNPETHAIELDGAREASGGEAFVREVGGAALAQRTGGAASASESDGAALARGTDGAAFLSATVRQLLSHSGGVAMNEWTVQRLPGTRRVYSSAGYEIAAAAVEHAAEMPFAEYLRESVCEPLGMTSTRLEGSAGYAAVSTVADLELFAAEMCHPTLVAGAYYDVISPDLAGVVPGYGMFSPCPWALGPEVAGTKPQQREHWMGKSLPAQTVGHFGQSGTFVWVVPGKHWAVVLTDRDFGPWAKPLWAEWNTALGRVLMGE